MELLAFCLVVIWLVRRSKRRKRQRITTSNFQNQNSNAGVVSVPLLAPNLNQALGDGWFPDPTGRYVMRYWNGQNWTEWVSSNDGRSKSDPIITKISQRCQCGQLWYDPICCAPARKRYEWSRLK